MQKFGFQYFSRFQTFSFQRTTLNIFVKQVLLNNDLAPNFELNVCIDIGSPRHSIKGETNILTIEEKALQLFF